MAPVLAGVHRTTRRVFSLLATVGLVAGMLATTAGPTAAASFTVTTLDDSGTGSLRQAVADANAAPGAETITFKSGLSGTITLTSGQIEVTSELTIDGPGASVVTVSGDNASGIFISSSSAPLTVNGLTLTAGNSEFGGAIFADAALTVTNSTFSGNSAANLGGAIRADATLTVTNSTFSSNSVTHLGGAISASYVASVTVTNSTFSGNSAANGGAIDAVVTVAYSTFSDNSAMDNGGAIAGGATVTNSTFSANSALYGGAIDAGGVTVTNSTFSDNSAWYGGGIDASGGVVTYSTFSGNSADYGGAIYASGAVTFTNSILAGSGMQCAGTVSVDGGNRSTDASCPGTLATSVQLALGPLASNSGPTQTIALLPGSVAIDAGTGLGCPATDQRGVSRPQGAACDAGAYEYAPDADGDGVINVDDICRATDVNEAAPPNWSKNHYWTNVVGEFVDPYGRDSGYDLIDTGGCSASQIIMAVQLGAGHLKHGISKSALDTWVASVNS